MEHYTSGLFKSKKDLQVTWLGSLQPCLEEEKSVT